MNAVKKEEQLGLAKSDGVGAMAVFRPDESPREGTRLTDRRSQSDATGSGFVEYEFEGTSWRCNQFDLLKAELDDLTPQTLALFHGQVSLRERAWLIVRRLFGLQPLLPPSGYATDDLRVWMRDELKSALGLTTKQLQAELDAVRGSWRAIAPPPPPSAPPPPPSRRDLPFATDDLLKRYDIRIKFRDQDEADVFLKRIADYEKLLNEPRVRGLARNTLMTEFQLRRLDEYIAGMSEGTVEWRKNLEIRKSLDQTYNDQLEQINKLAPWAGMIAGKFAFAGVLSDVTRAFQEYCGRGDTALADGIFTATEIAVECRRSVQASEPRYRAGLVVYLNEAKAGLFEPRFESQFLPGQLKRLTESWRATYLEAETEAGVPLPDLEKEGEEGEYAELPAIVTQANGANVEP